MKPVCMVIGAGAGIGGNVARRFAAEGYHAVLCRRTNEEGLRTLVDGIVAEGGAASGFLLDAVKPESIEDRIAAVESEIGPIEVLVFNLGAQFRCNLVIYGELPGIDDAHVHPSFDGVV